MGASFSAAQFARWPSPVNFTGTPFTIAFWIRTSDTGPANSGYLRITDPDNSSSVIAVWPASWARGVSTQRYYTTASKFKTKSAFLALNTWEHVLITDTAAGLTAADLSQYLNGALQSVTSSGSGSGTEGNFPGPVRLGGYAGVMAEVGIWTRVLEPGEIAALAAGDSPLFISAGRVFYAALTEEDGWEASGVSATLTGTPTIVSDHPIIKYPHFPEGGVGFGGAPLVYISGLYTVDPVGGVAMGGSAVGSHVRVVVHPPAGGVGFGAVGSRSRVRPPQPGSQDFTWTRGVPLAGAAPGSFAWWWRGVPLAVTVGPRTQVRAPAGGIAFGGAPALTHVRVIPVAPSGGLALGGTTAGLHYAPWKRVFPDGGVAFGAAPAITWVEFYTVPSAGGLAFGGTAEIWIIQGFGPMGGIAFGGAPSLSRVRGRITSGGIAFGGTTAVTHVAIARRFPKGGVAFGGRAACTYVGVEYHPMFTRWTVSQRLDLPADSWEGETVNTSAAVQASIRDHVTLAVGYKRDGQVHLATLLDRGVIDEYTVSQNAQSQFTATLRGRNKAAELCDRFVDLLFPVIVYGEDGTESERSWYARDVAEQIATSAGLGLLWSAPNYELVSDFQASGRPIDLIRSLVSVWDIFEPLKIDVYVRGTTVIVRRRILRPQADLDNTFSITGASIKNLVYRKTPLPPIDKITALGQVRPPTVKIDTDKDPGAVPVVLAAEYLPGDLHIQVNTAPEDGWPVGVFGVRLGNDAGSQLQINGVSGTTLAIAAVLSSDDGPADVGKSVRVVTLPVVLTAPYVAGAGLIQVTGPPAPEAHLAYAGGHWPEGRFAVRLDNGSPGTLLMVVGAHGTELTVIALADDFAAPTGTRVSVRDLPDSVLAAAYQPGNTVLESTTDPGWPPPRFAVQLDNPEGTVVVIDSAAGTFLTGFSLRNDAFAPPGTRIRVIDVPVVLAAPYSPGDLTLELLGPYRWPTGIFGVKLYNGTATTNRSLLAVTAAPGSASGDTIETTSLHVLAPVEDDAPAAVDTPVKTATLPSILLDPYVPGQETVFTSKDTGWPLDEVFGIKLGNAEGTILVASGAGPFLTVSAPDPETGEVPAAAAAGDTVRVCPLPEKKKPKKVDEDAEDPGFDLDAEGNLICMGPEGRPITVFQALGRVSTGEITLSNGSTLLVEDGRITLPDGKIMYAHSVTLCDVLDAIQVTTPCEKITLKGLDGEERTIALPTPGEWASWETYGEDGSVQRVNERTNNAPWGQVAVNKETYAQPPGGHMSLVSREHKHTLWDGVSLDRYGKVVGTPKMIREGARTTSMIEGEMLVSMVQSTQYGYNEASGKLKLEVTSTQELDPETKRLVPSETVVKTYGESGALQIKTNTTRARYNPDTRTWETVEVSSQVQGGHRAGGTIAKDQRDNALNNLEGACDEDGREKQEYTFADDNGEPNPDPTADRSDGKERQAKAGRNIWIDDANLDPEMLADLVRDADKVRGPTRPGPDGRDGYEDGTWEHDFQFDLVGCPWVQAGTIIQLTGWKDETGLPVPLQPMLVYEATHLYAETRETLEYSAHLGAVFWARGDGTYRP